MSSVVALACAGASSTAIAQTTLTRSAAQAAVTVRAGKANWGGQGTTVTAPVIIGNPRPRLLQTVQRIDLPPDWRLLMGKTPLTMQSGESALLMVGFAVPARAAAGPYVVTVRVFDVANERLLGLDSIVVVVPRRRALEVAMLDRPRYVVSGKSYDAGFLVRNRGNMPTTIRLVARSSLGAAAIPDTAIHLAADEERTIHAHVRTPSGLEAAMDDVLEIVASETGVQAPNNASARVTIIPEPNRQPEQFLRLPTQVSLRAANTDGVSPYEVYGHGVIRDRSTAQIDFLFRGPTGRYSAFGERDEYRAELVAPSWRARVGDHMFQISQLTGGAQPGLGAGADVTRGAFGVGGYGQYFRRNPEKGSEGGAFVSMRPFSDARLAANFVDRQGGTFAGRVGSATAAYSRPSFDADFELARSQSATGALAGLAHSARISGRNPAFSFDLGHLFADTAFAGSQRGAEHDYLTSNAQPWRFVSFGLNGSTHRSDLGGATGVPYRDRLDMAALSTILFDRLLFEGSAVRRSTSIAGSTQVGEQRGGRARIDQDVLLGTLWLEGEAGRATEDLLLPRNYTDVSVGIRRAFSRGSLAGWTSRYSGGSITKGTQGTDTYGGDMSLRLTATTEVMVMGYATRVRMIAAEWHSQIDGRISQQLPNGGSISFRARVIGGGSLPVADQTVGYLEYGMPLRLPVGRLRTPGRVLGRVVDATSGRGVANALVRLGPQVALTNKEGQVAFGGVPAGEHRLSMSQETTLANAVFVGDPTLVVDGTRGSPTTFRLAIASSARLDVDVHRFVVARTGVAGLPDSLSDAGPVANATLVLAGERDTLYRTTTDNGKVLFTDIPPGHWIVTIRGDAPAFHRFDPDRIEVSLSPGETKELAFKLVPRKREVQIIGDGQELRSTPAMSKTPSPTAPTRTGKPRQR
jgi:hypothetical protein